MFLRSHVTADINQVGALGRLIFDLQGDAADALDHAKFIIVSPSP